jgi:hypothetical protein
VPAFSFSPGSELMHGNYKSVVAVVDRDVIKSSQGSGKTAETGIECW